ncbi:class I SAM-dependent methyltransferase [Phytoactinopolyspora halotolerans]|uniref:Methyltransferase domain-containing protein n=1 Tax=Phytoactinopolyspora halotolerans TaxID=1981512 RepID=A0A6L9SGF7_9ACTN|nr:class I SAM-dependent methyltransferase [Phytoactinopolyspora halotolerans]NEE03471.1 methyltransferase domain-containing protein [Phytoactinopolyspora halotolerans]
MSQTHEQPTTRAFDAAAAGFQDLGRYLWEPIGAATVAATAPQPGERVLDACCGNGASAIPAAHRVGPDGLVDAVDLSAPMIDELNALAGDLPQLRSHHADATTWPADGYDTVQSALGIFFFPDMAVGTEWLIGRARPNGRVGLTIWRDGAMEAAGHHLHAAIAQVTGTEPPKRPQHPIFAINKADAYRSWLVERGLTDVDIATHELRLPMTPDIAWLVITGSGFVGALSALSPADVDAVRDAYLTSLSEQKVDELDATTLIGTGTTPG